MCFLVAPVYMMVHARNKKSYCSMRFQVKGDDDCQWKTWDWQDYVNEVYTQEYAEATAEARYGKAGIYSVWQQGGD